jgi:hypothetical protein
MLPRFPPVQVVYCPSIWRPEIIPKLNWKNELRLQNRCYTYRRGLLGAKPNPNAAEGLSQVIVKPKDHTARGAKIKALTGFEGTRLKVLFKPKTKVFANRVRFSSWVRFL